jgi:hypothetical protein
MMAVTDALELLGFQLREPHVTRRTVVRDTAGKITRESQEVRFRHLRSGARVSVNYDWRSGKVLSSEWTPPATTDWDKPQPPADHPPRTMDEWADEVRGVAYRLADEHGIEPSVGEVVVNPEVSDHAGSHRGSDGKITLGSESPDVLQLAARAAEPTASAKVPSSDELRGAWGSYKLGVHEALHGANPIPAHEYAHAGKALEEALTEELAHVEAERLARSHGSTRMLGWLRQNPDDPKAVGSYYAYRAATRRPAERREGRAGATRGRDPRSQVHDRRPRGDDDAADREAARPADGRRPRSVPVGDGGRQSHHDGADARRRY